MLLIGILFGLAMDYEVFLIVRERFVHTGKPRESIVTGYRPERPSRHGSRGDLRRLRARRRPGREGDRPLAAFGVLVDAFVIRMTLVPAAMALMGRSAWWLPRRLDRSMPNVDIEGEACSRPSTTLRADAPRRRCRHRAGGALR